MKLLGREDSQTLTAANNFADSLCDLDHLDEAKLLLRKTIPVARRVLGEGKETTLRMRCSYARMLSLEAGESVADALREAVDTLEDVVRISRRVLGDAHPLTKTTEAHLRPVRGALETIRTL